MPAMFETGFFVREPAWHNLGVVLPDYPGREEAMRLAGHDFRVIERPVAVAGREQWKQIEGWKCLVKSGDGNILNVTRDSYEVIQNEAAYDIAELLFDQGFQYETGVTLDGGALCALTLKLNEPVQISGDDSIVLPFGCLSWAHDGSGSLKLRSTIDRQVCQNTVARRRPRARSSARTSRSGTRRTSWSASRTPRRPSGPRAAYDVFRGRWRNSRDSGHAGAAGSLREHDHRRPGRAVSRTPHVGARQEQHRERADEDQLALHGSPSRRRTRSPGYGLHLAGGEYFDHLRRSRSARRTATSSGRCCTDNPRERRTSNIGS
jgi:phage/plasmid-like protein (TIGR03299 family)